MTVGVLVLILIFVIAILMLTIKYGSELTELNFKALKYKSVGEIIERLNRGVASATAHFPDYGDFSIGESRLVILGMWYYYANELIDSDRDYLGIVRKLWLALPEVTKTEAELAYHDLELDFKLRLDYQFDSIFRDLKQDQEKIALTLDTIGSKELYDAYYEE